LGRMGPTPDYTAQTPEEIQRWIGEVEAPRRSQAAALEQEYFGKLADALDHKRGVALAVSLETLVSRGPQPPAPAVVRKLIENFAALPEAQQTMLLTTGWRQLANPQAATFLRTVAAGSGQARDAALVRLRELDPDEARRIAMDRIQRGDVMRNEPGSDTRALLTLPDQTLPGLDNALLAALEQGNPVDLLVAHYASEAALTRVKAFLERSQSMCGNPLLAYLFRVDAAVAADLLRQARARPSGCALNTGGNEDLLMSAGLERQAIDDLANTDPGIRMAAASLLQFGGSSQAEQPLWDALNRVRERAAGAFDPSMFALEQALSKAAAWTLTPEKISRLVEACASTGCGPDAVSARLLLADPIGVMLDFPGSYAMIGFMQLRSRAQLEQKISQFPKGTRFVVQGNQGTWYDDRRRQEIRGILEAAGMRLADLPTQTTDPRGQK